MVKLDELIEAYYTKFVGLPANRPIVRQNQKNDAFEIVVLETLYGGDNYSNINISKMTPSDSVRLAKYIVAPPDEGIDIVVEKEDIEGNSYDFVQVKNASLSQLEIQQALSYMEKTVDRYLKKPSDLNTNLLEVLNSTSFSGEDRKNCRFILVHRGETNFFKGQKESTEKVITGTELETIREGNRGKVARVPLESFSSDSFNNFSVYEESENNPAILVNICGYDLARLALKYTNTSLGRNILFGQNLRESLSDKQSKTYRGMEETIRKEPEKFWFYNNGITIIAEDYDAQSSGDSVDRFTLKNFSIINGAQTTSALGLFLKNAMMNRTEEDIELLKRVFVLTRILKVTDSEFKSRIAIYNNTQNPITTRDMVSNREEQRWIHYGLLQGETPNIYVEIRRGEEVPADVRLYKHQYTTNIELAQLAFAGFLRNPSVAKDKKNNLFNTDYDRQSDSVLINEYYDKLFHYTPGGPEQEQGLLVSKSKEEINELLFVYYLYTLSKKQLISLYKEKATERRERLQDCRDENERKRIENAIFNYESQKVIANGCVFYCMAYYYGFKENFAKTDQGMIYRYEDFYSDSEFRSKLIKAFGEFFLTGTIETIKNLTEGVPNLTTWLRDKKSTSLFIDTEDDKLQIDLSYEEKYEEYVQAFKKNK